MVNPARTITLAPVTLPSGTVGTAYTQAITVTGGMSPYTYTYSKQRHALSRLSLGIAAIVGINGCGRGKEGNPTQPSATAYMITVNIVIGIVTQATSVILNVY